MVDAAWFQDRYRYAVRSLEGGNAAAAEASARDIQSVVPGEVNSLRILGMALHAQARDEEAAAELQTVLALAPDFADAWLDLAATFRALGRLADAADAARRAVSLDGSLHAGWRMLGDLLATLGEFAAANDAFGRFIASDPKRARLEAAGAALRSGSRPQAEAHFRAVLREDPDHVGALCGLAAISLTAGYPQDAQRLLRHARGLTSHMPLVTRGLGQTLTELGNFAAAEAAVRHSLLIDQRSTASWVLLGTILAHTLRQSDALAAYDRALDLDASLVRVQLSKGHVLKTLGRRSEAESAYRRCIAMQANFAEGYWSLADLKNYRFDAAEIAAMRRLPNSAHRNFALGRAHEQRQEHALAFRHYARGNELRRLETPFDIDAFERKSARVMAAFDAALFASRRSQQPAGAFAEPIFIVGLPRSGSTLLEQVLASHSAVDGTMELPNVLTYVREFERQHGGFDAYPEAALRQDPAAWAALGRRYLEETRIFRGAAARFIDKMPNNFSHIGLILLMLPNATVIDARRHPLDTCWSAYKQYFAKGQAFTYDLRDLGRYYRAYVRLMEHWDQVAPGAVLRVQYEDLVHDTENQVRTVLRHCGLPFESGCLRFHENKRAVRTASSEQVRQPMYSTAIGQWRHVADELLPLRTALGDLLPRMP